MTQARSVRSAFPILAHRNSRHRTPVNVLPVQRSLELTKMRATCKTSANDFASGGSRSSHSSCSRTAQACRKGQAGKWKCPAAVARNCRTPAHLSAIAIGKLEGQLSPRLGLHGGGIEARRKQGTRSAHLVCVNHCLVAIDGTRTADPRRSAARCKHEPENEQ